MLFTYTDKDGYVPPCDKADGGGGALTTGDGGPFSYLGEAVTNMPRKAAISSLEPTTSPGEVRGVGGGRARAGVSETAAVIQTHLAREDKFKVRKTATSVIADTLKMSTKLPVLPSQTTQHHFSWCTDIKNLYVQHPPAFL